VGRGRLQASRSFQVGSCTHPLYPSESSTGLAVVLLDVFKGEAGGVGEVINFAANGCEAFAPPPQLGVNQFVPGLQKSTQTAESDAYKRPWKSQIILFS
jgi:hypothetical protein